MSQVRRAVKRGVVNPVKNRVKRGAKAVKRVKRRRSRPRKSPDVGAVIIQILELRAFRDFWKAELETLLDRRAQLERKHGVVAWRHIAGR